MHPTSSATVANVRCNPAATGSEIWRQKIGSPPGEGLDMAPIVYDGIVYISTVPGTGLGSFYAGGDRGVLYALDALTGEAAWWWDTTGDNYSWGNGRLAGGGGLWYPPSIDADGNIYFGVGNPAPWPMTPDCPNGSCRPGDNLYTSSMVSLDPATSGLRWYYQDAPVLATVDVYGTPTDVAIGSGKTGTVVAVSQDTGEVLWKTPVGKHENDDLDELPTDGYVEVYPGSLGGVETPIAYKDGVLFVTYLDYPQYQGATGSDPDTSVPYGDGTGGIVAINAADGSLLWENILATLPVGAATVSNDLVFTAGVDGFVRGFDITTGQEVWTYEAEMGINAPLAIAGDTLFVGAGFVKFSPAGSAPAATPEGGEAPRRWPS